MNRLAGRIGMTDSHFENPNGLDGEAHYSTARDMAKLASYASKQPTFLRICSTTTAHVGGRTMTNHNRLLREVDGTAGGWWLSPCRTATTGPTTGHCMNLAFPGPTRQRRRRFAEEKNDFGLESR